MCDDQCHAEHGEILDRIASVASAAESHVHDEIEELAVAVLGPRKTELAGGGRLEEQGVVSRLERIERHTAKLEQQVANGGVPSKLSPKDRAAIIVAAITSTGGVGVALVALLK